MQDTRQTETVVPVQSEIDVEQLESLTRDYNLADAILEGCENTTQAFNWGDGQATACAMSAAVIAAEKKGFSL